MSSELRSHPSVSLVFDLAPRTAAAAFDLMVLDPVVGADLIPAGPLQRAAPSGYDFLRRLPGRLALPGRSGRSLDVVLELLPWSDHRSELLISTTARPHLPVERRAEIYLRAAHGYLANLAGLLDTGHLVPQEGRRPGHLQLRRVPAQEPLSSTPPWQAIAINRNRYRA